MINTKKMNAYLTRSGHSWKEIAGDIGGIPASLHEFAATFEDNATADTVAALVSGLHIPASDIGPTFFAPATYDENSQSWSPAAPDNLDDELQAIVLNLSPRSRHQILELTYNLQEKEATV